jgi:uncharacterized protein (DUF2147 family)
MKSWLCGPAFVFAFAVAGAAYAADPTGTWVMSNGKVTVRLSKCASRMCAKIVSLAEPLDRSGRRKVDKLNPNAALRKRPLIGLTLSSNLVPAGKDVWKGSIYNPDDGRTYAASIKLTGATMKVSGCVAGVLCKTQSFRKR